MLPCHSQNGWFPSYRWLNDKTQANTRMERSSISQDSPAKQDVPSIATISVQRSTRSIIVQGSCKRSSKDMCGGEDLQESHNQIVEGGTVHLRRRSNAITGSPSVLGSVNMDEDRPQTGHKGCVYVFSPRLPIIDETQEKPTSSLLGLNRKDTEKDAKSEPRSRRARRE